MYLFVGLFLFLLTVGASAQESPNDSQAGPVASTVMGRIKKLPNGGRPPVKVSFPEIRDWNSLEITLQRGACFGNCSAYEVRIKGDGTVEYDGHSFVTVPGHHIGHVTQAAVRELYNKLRNANFFWLFDRYAAPITDNPEYQIGIAFDDKRKSVTDYIGRAVGMPAAVTDIENAIDATAGTKKWVTGSAETIPALKDERVNFAAHPELLVGAAERGDTQLLSQLLGLGVPAENKFGCHALLVAAGSRQLDMVQTLLFASAPIHYEPPDQPIAEPKTDAEKTASITYYEDICDVLQSAVAGANPQILSMVLAHKPDLNWTPPYGRKRSPLIVLAENSGNSYAAQHGADFGRCAQLLIDAGADVNAVDDNGNTALMEAGEDVGVVQIILKAGVRDIDTRNSLGETALMHAYRPEVAQALLEAGADPFAKDNDGKTTLDHLKRFNDPGMTGVLERWVAAHPK